MIASWMFYALVVGLSLTVAAEALERVAAARRLPVRYIWAAAILLSVAGPAVSALRRLAPAPIAPVAMLPFTITLPPTTAIASGPDRGAMIDRGALVLWCAFSAFLLLRLSRAVVTLRRTRNGWRLSDVDGTAVRLSTNVGPAVVGLRSMDVVLPEWILTLDAPLRAIVLRHEEEHRAARDPQLLFGAAVAVALMPWNIALWLQARRLRLAIEMDCDVRVLRAHPSPERYGMLMLTIAQRRSLAPALFAPMLSEPATQLERRILAMRSTTRRLARVTILGGSLLAAGVLLFACALQSDNPLAPSPSASKTPVQHDTYFEFQVTKPVTPAPGNMAPRYPDMLRSSNVEGDVLAQFVVDTMGNADMFTFKVLRSTHDLFTAAVRGSLATMKFVPAEVGGRKVKQLVQMPFMFSLSKVAVDTAAMTRARVIALAGEKPLAGSAGPDIRCAKGGSGPDACKCVARCSEVLRLSPVSVQAVPKKVDSTQIMEQRLHQPRADGPTPIKSDADYFEYQVEKQVSPYPGNPAPRYPAMLRSANVEGVVLAQFVVDTSGHADMSTFKVLKSTHDLFTESVRAALPNMRFYPALVGGRPVKQVLQMPFQFGLTKH